MKSEDRVHGMTAGIVLMLLCTACLCSGQLIWKMTDGLLSVIGGFCVYGLGALAMLCAYRFGSLSVLQPINSMSYVIAVILGAVLFQEAVTPWKIIGILAVIVGVIFLAKGDQTE